MGAARVTVDTITLATPRFIPVTIPAERWTGRTPELHPRGRATPRDFRRIAGGCDWTRPCTPSRASPTPHFPPNRGAVVRTRSSAAPRTQCAAAARPLFLAGPGAPCTSPATLKQRSTPLSKRSHHQNPLTPQAHLPRGEELHSSLHPVLELDAVAVPMEVAAAACRVLTGGAIPSSIRGQSPSIAREPSLFRPPPPLFGSPHSTASSAHQPAVDRAPG
ncbi:hypothetical protein QYE76_043349 [Lolium multiflorum]|uniref:Uncharacterized protein n=1 Tax=Lolium multiflorum TaxID=4521 RepID=A0AAD8WXU8_LOLMU|nr:hypothetical protein QYE76_043349 [Lolium multiflorum]